MRELDYAASVFTEAIKSTAEFREYVRQKEMVKNKPGLKAALDEYRRRNFEIQNSNNESFEEIEKFEREYAAFREDPLVDAFLAAELAFCRMMQEVTLHITESLDFE